MPTIPKLETFRLRALVVLTTVILIIVASIFTLVYYWQSIQEYLLIAKWVKKDAEIEEKCRHEIYGTVGVPTSLYDEKTRNEMNKKLCGCIVKNGGVAACSDTW